MLKIYLLFNLKLGQSKSSSSLFICAERWRKILLMATPHLVFFSSAQVLTVRAGGELVPASFQCLPECGLLIFRQKSYDKTEQELKSNFG